MEDDPRLTSVQLWVNRTLQHAKAAHSYGVTGYFGIFWRIRATSPQMGMLARVGWSLRADGDPTEYWRQWGTAFFTFQRAVRLITFPNDRDPAQ